VQNVDILHKWSRRRTTCSRDRWLLGSGIRRSRLASEWEIWIAIDSGPLDQVDFEPLKVISKNPKQRYKEIFE